MTDRIQQRHEHCANPQCRHDKASHYREPGANGAWVTCLCTGCECKRYRAEGEAAPVTPRVQYPIIHGIDPDLYDDPDPPKTDPYPYGYGRRYP